MTQKISQDNLFANLHELRSSIKELERNATLLGWQLDEQTLGLGPDNTLRVPPGGISAIHIGSVNAGVISGTITANMIGSINANQITGTISANQIGSVNAISISGTISAGQIGSVSAGTITGTIAANQIGAVNASSITGSIAAEQIGSVNATAISGQLTAGQILDVNAGSISGQITAGQIANIGAGQITGQITSGQISSVSAGTITGGITSGQIASVSASTITGGITATQITSVNAGAISGTIGASQIGSVNANTITGSIGASQIGAVNAGVIQGQIGSGQISSVTAGQITGSIAGSQIAATAIDGFTITGAIIRTGTTGARWEGTPTGIRGYNSNNEVTFAFDTATGKITTLAGIGGANLLKDSSAEIDTLPDWVGVNATRATETTIIRSGLRSIKLTSNAAGNISARPAVASRPKVTPGATYTASAYFRSDSIARSARVYLDWYDSAGTRITPLTTGSSVTTSTTDWVRPTVTGTAPSNAVTVQIIAEIVSTAAAGEIYYVDDLQVEEGSIVTAYAPKPDEILPGTVTGGQISPTAGIAGSQIASVIASTISGGITSGQITSVAATTITGSITSGQIGSVAASTITGSISASQIGSVNASAITGTISASQIGSVNASAITGTISASQIGSVNASAITGTISSSQIGSVSAGTITGSITASQIGSIHAGNLIVGGSGDGKMDGALVKAGTITAGHITVAFPTTNLLLNSNFNDGVAGRSTLTTQWYGIYESSTNVISGIGYPGGYAVYGTATGGGGGAHIYTPFAAVGAFGVQKVSVAVWSHSGNSRQRRLVCQFANSAGNVTSSSATFDSAAVSGWYRSIHEDIPIPAGTYYIRFYIQILGTTTEQVHFAAAQIEQGEKVSGWALAAGDIVPGSVGETKISPGAINTGHLQSNSVTTQKIKVTFGGQNVLTNARFDHWPSGDNPYMWAQYMRGGTGTKAYSKVAAGGPNGENSWRLVLTGTDTFHGFSSQGNHKILPNVTYVQSWWWKGNGQPEIASNTSWNVLNEWIENPTTSTTVWQRYSKRLRSTTGGGVSGQTDYFYVYVDSTNVNRDVQIALPQWEMGEFPSAHTSKTSEELLPGAVTETIIAPGSITTNLISATGIEGKTIRTGPVGTTRVQLDTSGLQQFIGNSGTPTVHLKTDGNNNIFTGTIEARGINFPYTTTQDAQARWVQSGSERFRITSAGDGNGANAVSLYATRVNDSVFSTIELANQVTSGGATNNLSLGRTVVSIRATSADAAGEIQLDGNIRQTGGTYTHPYRLVVGTENEPTFDFSVNKQSNYCFVHRRSNVIAMYATCYAGTYSFYSYNQGGINYGPFTGGHDVRLKGDASTYIKGMIVSSTGDVAHTPNKQDISTSLPQVERSTKANAKAVFGVFNGELNDSTEMSGRYYTPKPGERIAAVNAVGDGLVLVCDTAGEIENGDLVTASDIPGIGERQADNAMRNITVAKALEPANFAAEPIAFIQENGTPVKVKLIACTYHCG